MTALGTRQHRVPHGALERLEPCTRKRVRTVLRGGGGGNAAPLLGGSAPGQTVTHTYQTADRFNVTVTATDGVNSASRTFEENILAPGITSLTASASPDSACVNSPIQFTASATDSCPGKTINYTWIFDDMGTASGASVSHQFATPGAHNGHVVADDGFSQMSRDVGVTVNGPSIMIDSVTATPSMGATTCDDIQFTAQATAQCTGQGITYTWIFDDGETGSGASVSHHYYEARTFHVTCTATSGGVSASQVIDVQVAGCDLSKDNEPGNQPQNDPQVPLSCGGMCASINGFSGNFLAVLPDPIATRGWPIVCNIAVNSQTVEYARPMGNGSFTYDIHVTTQVKYPTPCNGETHWIVVDADGTRLDFGTVGGGMAGGRGIFSQLVAAGAGYQLLNAGPPGSIASAGNFTYDFNQNGWLTKITDPAGNQQVVSIGPKGPEFAQDLNTGKYITFLYTGDRLTRVVQGGGMEYTDLTYSGNLLTSATIKNGGGVPLITVSFGYSGGRLDTITRDNNPNTALHLTYKRWPARNCTSSVYLANEFDAFRHTYLLYRRMPGPELMLTDTNAKGGITTYWFNIDGDCRRVKLPRAVGMTQDLIFTFGYNFNHQIVSASDGPTTVHLDYTGNGLIQQFINELSKIWSWTWLGADIRGSNDPLQHQESVVYVDPAQPHVPTSYTDPSGQVWNFGHNGYGQTLSVTPPQGSPTGQINVFYDESPPGGPNRGYPTYAIDANGDRVTFDAYDAMGDLLQISTYPVNGNTEIKNTTIFGWDAAQRPTYLLHPDNHMFQWFYAGANLDHVLDEAGSRYDFSYCAPCGALTGITGPLGWSLGVTLDGDGDVTEFHDARDKVTLYDYGLAREPKKVTYPDGSYISGTYNNRGFPSTVTTSGGRNIGFDWDGAGRLLSAGQGWWDSVLLSYNQDDSLQTMTDPAGATTFTYTADGQVASVVYDYRAKGLPNLQEIDYTYYPDGSRSSMTWKNGIETVGTWNYSYDAGGRLIALAAPHSGGAAWSYDGEGKLLAQNTGVVSSQYSFNEARGWPTNITYRSGFGGGGPVIASYGLTYDNGLNTVGNLTNVSEIGGVSHNYGYDGLYRLTAESHSAPAFGHTYGYDLAGNRTNVDGFSYGFDSANKQSILGHDGDGNVTSIPANEQGYSHTLGWNVFGEVSYIRDEVGNVIRSVGYVYDGFGRRVISEPMPGIGKVFYIFDGDLLLGEMSANGDLAWVNAQYNWGAAGLISTFGSQTGTLWYVFGPQGETRQLRGSYGLADTYAYTAYGAPVSATNNNYNPFRFGGQFGYYTDPNGGQDIMLCGARWYDATLGRWLSRDPIDYDGGPNLYEYCGGDPINSCDPTGLDTVAMCGRNNKNPGFFDRQAMYFFLTRRDDPKWKRVTERVTYVQVRTAADVARVLKRHKNIDALFYFGHAGQQRLFLSEKVLSPGDVSKLPTRNLKKDASIYLVACHTADEPLPGSMAQAFADRFKRDVNAVNGGLSFGLPLGGSETSDGYDLRPGTFRTSGGKGWVIVKPRSYTRGRR